MALLKRLILHTTAALQNLLLRIQRRCCLLGARQCVAAVALFCLSQSVALAHDNPYRVAGVDELPWESMGTTMQFALPALAAVQTYAHTQATGDVAHELQLLSRFAFLNAAVNMTKALVREPRPAQYCKELNSFPSGHTAAAFAGASVLASQTKHAWVKVASYTAASLVGYSRIETDHHHLHDVLAGAALGAGVMLLPASYRAHVALMGNSAGGVSIGYTLMI